MKSKLPLVLLLSVPALFTSELTLASEQEGVKCPNGYSADISNGNKSLKCSKDKTYTLTAICPPQSAPMDPKGEDRCLPLLSGTTRPSIMPPLPTLPGFPSASCFRRIVVANAADNFVCQGKEYVFPQGTIYNPLHKPTNGVQCPSGYDGDVQFGGKGIRCRKNDGGAKPADCDFPWSWEKDRDGNKDQCVLANQAGPTVPHGITKIQLDIEKARGDISWHLDVRSGRDSWQKRIYKYPSSSN